MAETAYDLLRGTASKANGEYEGMIATDILGHYTEETLHGSCASASIARPAKQVVQLDSLITKELSNCLEVAIENDGDCFVATAKDIPLYGYGDSKEEAIEMLLHEIEDLHQELAGEDAFTAEWVAIKEFLDHLIK
jgi:hypothetical protein